MSSVTNAGISARTAFGAVFEARPFLRDNYADAVSESWSECCQVPEAACRLHTALRDAATSRAARQNRPVKEADTMPRGPGLSSLTMPLVMPDGQNVIHHSPGYPINGDQPRRDLPKPRHRKSAHFRLRSDLFKGERFQNGLVQSSGGV